jgi:long-chain acyl-CoA synthetase
MTIVHGEPLAVSPADLPASVVELVHRSVERRPDKEAIRWRTAAGWQSWTYRELWNQVAATSIGLRGLGMAAGDRVIILARSRPEWLVADLACQALGAVPCPLYPGDPPARMADLVASIGPRLVLVEDAKLLDRLRSGMGDTQLSAQVVLVEGHDGEGLPALADLATTPTSEALVDWERTWRAIHPSQVATIVHTMGADGVPLGVMVSHANLVHSFHATIQIVPISSSDVALSVLPMSHMFERGVGILVPIGVGATVAFAERQIDRWPSNMAEVRPTLMASIPLFYERFEQRVLADLARGPGYRRALFGWAAGQGRRHYENRLAGRADGPVHRLQRRIAERTVLAPVRGALGGRLRYLMSGGAALPEASGLFFESIGIPILEGYGLTETAPILTGNRPASNRYGTVGRPVAGTELRIDPDTGEIRARGPQIMLGYLNRPAETRATVDAEGWLHTGDIGHADRDGDFFVVDRLKELIKYKGMQVAPAQLEDVLLSHPAIADAAVVPFPDAEAGEIPRAFVVRKGAATAEEIMAYVAERVAPFKRVRRVDFVDAIPKSASGKILRRLLSDRP